MAGRVGAMFEPGTFWKILATSAAESGMPKQSELTPQVNFFGWMDGQGSSIYRLSNLGKDSTVNSEGGHSPITKSGH